MTVKEAKRKIEILLEVKGKIMELDRLVCDLFPFNGGVVFEKINTRTPFFIRYTQNHPNGLKDFFNLVFSCEEIPKSNDNYLDLVLGKVIENSLVDDLIEVDADRLLDYIKQIITAFEGIQNSTDYKDMYDKYYDMREYKKYPVFYEKAIQNAEDHFIMYIEDFLYKIRSGKPISYKDGEGSTLNRDGWSTTELLNFVTTWSEVLNDNNIDKYKFVLEYEQSKETED